MYDKQCRYGEKKSGGCKKKPGPKSHRSTSRQKRRSTCRQKRRSTCRQKRRSTSRQKRRYMTIARCKSELKEKIKINTREYNDGKFANRKQAIAIAYSQIKRKYPQCTNKI